MRTVRITGTVPSSRRWTDRIGAGEWYHWSRHERMLRTKPNWRPEQVDSVAAESLRILGKLPDPWREHPFQARGLVVGYVQSGKTANYTALAARAADAGYRIVIVLSGIHDSLRNQTQNRLERELTGHQDGGVGPAEIGREWIALTTPVSDFQNQDVRILQGTAPFLIVAKKHIRVLMKIDAWLQDAGRFLETMPVLVIDDEADQASINTGGNRDPGLWDDDEAEDDDSAPSRTNALIRSILGRAPMAAYVAYTATPFANILVNPSASDREFGIDLFPRDFVIQLPRPAGYTGTEELFGVSAQERDVLRIIPESDVRMLKGAPRRRRRSRSEIVVTGEEATLPASLTDALLAFCLAGAIRELRCRQDGRTLPAHTMLVHVSMRKDDQARVADLITEQIDLWRSALEQGQSLHGTMREAWVRQRPGIEPPDDDDVIINDAIAVLGRLAVSVLNSDTGEELDYEENPGRHLIAVGGNRLSRGLTLEGLTVSYFLRTASMCDTLLQMARWYGFRLGYEDLIRIWTTDGIARWFGELALVEQSMRDSIQALELAGRRPDQMAIRIRAHSDLLLTARNKSAMATSMWDSWSGDHPQTVLFPLDEPSRLQHNVEITDALLGRVAPSIAAHGGWMAHDVSPGIIAGYLSGYQVHDEAVAFRPADLARWILSRAANRELADWTVFVASPMDRRTVTLGSLELGLVERRRISSHSIGTLLDPRHEGVDLPEGPSAYRRPGGSLDAEAMRRARPVTRGLMIVYPLDPVPLGVADRVPAVIGLALSLPFTTDAGTEWVVNAGVADV
ncbi:Z1 domain-containing protein [Megalodesulfovibrio gigas]|uniref:Putative endonuclease Z1 domain-containing protein n=1 Tax=Megalodesulfovibrio gigas (strain ATCC 19364 / DSM 1382 / NCIMB 9332 / VKM B-1759) TaxID=1121448 RepID=T2G8C0_MEGG1|nr:Z1 domain-containing protein [Megalodesulfovibrio gigas]AGW12391.1 hypothetical protein DGI_0480 [Megalodesulfovibrio gigas DSM 1382 = ATCC 19364]